jgi:hypothetical protein
MPEILPEGGMYEIVTKAVERNGRAIQVEISDDGPGISGGSSLCL